MSGGAAELLLLVAAGLGAGFVGSVAGLASLVSYPALLAAGLPPLAANVTNTVGLLASSAGSAAASRPELRGQGRRVAALCAQTGLGGALGAALLLLTGEGVFEAVVPVLVGLGAVLLLARDRLRAWSRHRALRRAARAVDGGPDDPAPGVVWSGRRRWADRAVVVAVGVYGGYFGAAAGIILLAVLSLRTTEPLAVTNAVKNLGLGASNGVAAVAYVVLAPVHWPAAACLAAGVLVGSWLGPPLVRVLPETPLRWVVGVAGLALAAHLATS